MLLRLLGVVLLALTAVDIFLTVLLPSARGVLSGVWCRVLWRIASALPGRLGLQARQVSGPLSLVVTIASWVLLLWVGYALIYLPGAIRTTRSSASPRAVPSTRTDSM